MLLRMILVLLLIGSMTTVVVQAQDNLVGYWSMDEGAGNTVADVSGNGHDGTATNTTWVDGIYGKALDFNGADSVVDIPYFAEVTPGDGVTLAAWVYATDTTRSCVVGQFEGYGLAFFTGLTLKSVIWGDDWVSAEVIPMEQWVHVAMTWDQQNAERKMYVDGVLIDEKPNPAPVPNVQNNLGIGVWIGWPAAWGDDWFMGTIDEVKIWTRVLSAEEVQASAEQSAAVDARSKLPVLWGTVKSR